MLLQMDLYYAWVQMLLPMGPLLHLGLNQNIDIWPESLGVMSEFIYRTQLAIKEKRPNLNTQTHSIPAKLFT